MNGPRIFRLLASDPDNEYMMIDANCPRDVGLRVAALQERINLAALFAGQMEIAFGHFSLREIRCPTQG